MGTLFLSILDISFGIEEREGVERIFDISPFLYLLLTDSDWNDVFSLLDQILQRLRFNVLSRFHLYQSDPMPFLVSKVNLLISLFIKEIILIFVEILFKDVAYGVFIYTANAQREFVGRVPLSKSVFLTLEMKNSSMLFIIFLFHSKLPLLKYATKKWQTR